MEEARAGRGWGVVFALAVVTITLSVAVQPALLIFIPLALLLLALAPDRPLALLLGMFLLFVTFLGRPDGSHWFVERGWALMLGGWFVAAVTFLPNRGFLTRALSAVGASVGSAALLFSTEGRSFAAVDEAIANRLRLSAADILDAWRGQSWFEQLGGDVGTTLQRVAELQAWLYPALLSLASLASLAIAWWAYRRLVRAEARPLSSLREFRFNDGLIWLLIAGIALMLMPLNGVAERAGSNLLAFMAALYALRGLAVLLVLGGAPGPLGVLLGALVLLVLYPLVVLTTFLVGVSDTWLDIRTRRQAPGGPGA